MKTNWHLPDEAGNQLSENELTVLKGLLATFADHPGFRHPIWDWLAGSSYTLEELQTFAKVYYGHVQLFRKYLAGAITVSSIEDTQVALADILSEEYGCRYNPDIQGYGPWHPELYRLFMQSISVDPSESRTVPAIEGIEHFRSVHFAMFQGGEEVETIGAVVFGMESSTPYRHERVATGLDRFGADHGMAIDHTFFSRHVEVDPRHGQGILMTIRHWLDDSEKVELLRQGAFRSFDARKVFLDQVLNLSRR